MAIDITDMVPACAGSPAYRNGVSVDSAQDGEALRHSPV